MIKDDFDFLRVAMSSYDNPSCVDVNEFDADVRRISGTKRLVTKFLKEDNVNFRILLNSFIVLYNIFGERANDLLIYKYQKDDEALSCLIPIVSFLGRLDKRYDRFSHINPNKRVINELELI